MIKPLSTYIPHLGVTERFGEADPLIENIVFDSRDVKAGSAFVALPGTVADGHTFIQKAVDSGAAVVVCERMPDKVYVDVVFLKVPSSREVLAVMAAVFYDFPSRDLSLVGITGTNGKTTIASLLYHTARLLGYKAGLCSTIANYVNDEKLNATHTTPDVVSLNRLIRRMVDAGCDYCFMEVSSHAVHQKRIAALEFNGAVFTNITHDHLDYHKTFDAYIAAKKDFFDGLPKSAFALTNLDDKHGRVMVQNTPAEISTYSLREMADYRAKIVESHFEGMQLEMDGEEVWTPFIGRFNVSNLLAVYGAGRLLGWDKRALLVALSRLKPVDGRFETIRSASGVTAVVDYAHTPDALKNVLEALNDIRKPGQKVITVVGAGGNRDPLKRPLMASQAVRNSSKVIITSDNPRDEEPQTIIDQMMEGVTFEERIKVLAIVDRREAIRTACTIARPGDIVLVAGKGHETYQEVKGHRHHFDDREVVRRFFERSNT